MLNLHPQPPIQRYRVYDVRIHGAGLFALAFAYIVALTLLMALLNRPATSLPAHAAPVAVSAVRTYKPLPDLLGKSGRIHVYNVPDSGDCGRD